MMKGQSFSLKNIMLLVEDNKYTDLFRILRLGVPIMAQW